MGILKGNYDGKFFKINNPIYDGLGLKYGYAWFDSSGNLRTSATKPSALDSDGSLVGMGSGLTLVDAAVLAFGTDLDIKASWVNATSILAITQAVSGVGSVTFGADGKGIDQTFYLETASSYIKLDQAGDRMLFYIAKLDIGNATVTYDFALSTNSLVLSCTDNAAAKLILGTTGTNGLDIQITGAVSGDNWVFDAATSLMTYQGIFKAATRKTATKTTGTLAIGDVGTLLVVTADAQTITLPATVVGYVYVIQNGAAGQILTIDPNAVDMIMGVGLTAADNKDLINTAATAKKGDYITLLGDGVAGWYVIDMVGTWAREA